MKNKNAVRLGKRRWKGKSREEILKHSILMNKKRWKKGKDKVFRKMSEKL